MTPIRQAMRPCRCILCDRRYHIDAPLSPEQQVKLLKWAEIMRSEIQHVVSKVPSNMAVAIDSMGEYAAEYDKWADNAIGLKPSGKRAK